MGKATQVARHFGVSCLRIGLVRGTEELRVQFLFMISSCTFPFC